MGEEVIHIPMMDISDAEIRKREEERVWPTCYFWHGRIVSAPPGKLFKGLPSPGDALIEAKSSGKPVRDFNGGLNHPCGCGIGRNLLGEIPHGPCPEHGNHAV